MCQDRETNSSLQRESTASIKTAPKPYEQGEPPKAQYIIEFDCRGLEFTDFHPEASSHFCHQRTSLTNYHREPGSPKALILAQSSPKSNSQMENGMTTMIKPAKRSASRISSGTSRELDCISGTINEMHNYIAKRSDSN
jgi:hypothetical protein